VKRTFHVDLRGIVDLLSRHLYSSPQVYVRELVQNAVDAITARRAADAGSAARIWIESPEVTGDGSLRVHDNGIGLTEPQVHELLATIGGSSKRDDFGFPRHEFLGQFGIGLLSCFLVADEVTVETRSAAAEEAQTIRWVGHAEGSYTVAPADRPRETPGTTVILRARPGADEWLTAATVTRLARHYGALLPHPISVDGVSVTEGEPPWRVAYPDPQARRDALAAYAERMFGFRPFDVVDLAVPEADLTGVAFVLPASLDPTARATHRVYLHRMLLGDRVEKMLPEWAFFARCVVDSGELRPTANREQLYEDDLLHSVREALGGQLRDWLVALSAEPTRLREFLVVHHRGVRALALHDNEMLRLVDRWLEFETSDGEMTLAAYRRRHGIVRYTPSVDEFRQLAGVAAAQGVGLVNGGYAYEAEIIRRLPALDPEITVERLDPASLATHFDPLDPATELALRGFVDTARQALDRLGCEPVVRAFDPASLPALYLEGQEVRRQAELRGARDEAEGVWADVLGGAGPGGEPEARPQLVLNHRNPLVRRMTTVGDPPLVALAVEALYSQALLQSHHPMRPVDTATLNRSFLGLLEWAVHNRTGET
jgi:molecular chaperone HtpG